MPVNQSPYGRDGELEALLREIRGWLRDRAGNVALIAGGLLLVFLAWSSYYQVETDEVGLVTRFGRYLETSNPGPHTKLPFGIDRVQKVPVERQLKQEFGFRTMHADVRSEFQKDANTHAEALMLTGDLNVATVEWIVQYKISDPYKYLFKLRDVEQTFRLMSEASMRAVVGDHSVTELLTIGRESIAAKAKELLAGLCVRYDTGISVQQLVLQDVDPPEAVKDSFNGVNQAIQERERAINEAWAEYNQEIPRARGRAEQTMQGAEGYAVDRVNRAKGDAQRFIAFQTAFHKAPEVTRTRIYLETMAAILPTAGKKIILDEKARTVLPLLQLGGATVEAKQ